MNSRIATSVPHSAGFGIFHRYITPATTSPSTTFTDVAVNRYVEIDPSIARAMFTAFSLSPVLGSTFTSF